MPASVKDLAWAISAALSENRAAFGIGANSYAFATDPASNQLSGITGGAAPQSLAYDAAGNLLSDGSTTWAYSDRGRMSSATLANGDEYGYGYNAMGFRTVKQLPGAGQSENAVIYMRDPQGRLMGEFDAQGNTQEEIVWLGDMPLAVVARTGAISSNIGYIFADQINAPRAVVNSQNNALLWSWFQTDPFGRVEPNNNPQGQGVYDFDMRLPGQVHDNETGLDHNNARDYDPAIGRFVQSDPMGIFASTNPYIYTGNAPLIGLDPSGLVNENAFAPGTGEYNSADLIPIMPGVFSFAGHGTHGGVINVSGIGPDILNANAVAEMIRRNPDYKAGETVILYSCFTGVSIQGDLPFAQSLSNILHAAVIAPPELIWFRPNGSTIIAPSTNPEFGFKNIGHLPKDYGEEDDSRARGFYIFEPQQR